MSPAGLQITVLVAVLVLAVALAVLVVPRLRGSRRPGAFAPAAPDAAAVSPPARSRLAVVVNPTKLHHPETERAWIEGACALAGWEPPLWLETTVADPGAGQTRTALAEGVEVVAVLGGDGTLRTVAGEAAGSGVPIALLPAGTGNLLARNLDVPVADRAQALRLALFGDVRSIDIGRVEVDGPARGGPGSATPAFLVMAGLGFDADVMAAVDPRLKERLGWWAYVVAGAANLPGRRTRVAIHMDGRAPLQRRVRSIVVGNCGSLQGGVRLMPEARVDDGWLDVVAVSPRGVVGWVAVVTAVLTRSTSGPVIEHFRCRSVEIIAEHPLQAQLDGDPTGASRVLRAGVEHRSLLVKVGPA